MSAPGIPSSSLPLVPVETLSVANLCVASARDLIDRSQAPAHDKWVDAITKFRASVKYADGQIHIMREGAPNVGFDTAGRYFTLLGGEEVITCWRQMPKIPGAYNWIENNKRIVVLYREKLCEELASRVFPNEGEAKLVATYLKEQGKEQELLFQTDRVQYLLDNLFTGTLKTDAQEQVEALNKQLETARLELSETNKQITNILSNEVQSLTTYKLLDLQKLTADAARLSAIPDLDAFQDPFEVALGNLLIALQDTQSHVIDQMPAPTPELIELKDRYAKALKDHIKNCQILALVDFSAFCTANATRITALLEKLSPNPEYQKLDELRAFFGRFAHMSSNRDRYQAQFNDLVRKVNEIQAKIDQLQKTNSPMTPPIAPMPQTLIAAFSKAVR